MTVILVLSGFSSEELEQQAVGGPARGENYLEDNWTGHLQPEKLADVPTEEDHFDRHFSR